MKEKTYKRLLAVTIAVCFILTAVHMGYIIYAYKNSSISYFISQEIWP